MKRSMTRTAAAGAVLVLATLTGCSGDGGSDGDSSASSESTQASEGASSEGSTSGDGSIDEYCTALEEAKKQSESAAGTDLSASVESLRKLQDSAPDEVSGEWKTVVDGFDEFEQAIKDAGLTLDEFTEVAQDPSKLPKGVKVADVQKLGQELQTLNSPELTSAQDAIDAHAEKECGVNLNDTPGEAPTQ